MLEGQLFGYRRGAFTGAVSDAKGLIREAEGGTLFIDEIGDLDADLQPKLLRSLESGEIQPLGERPQRVDVRIVAATNARLEDWFAPGASARTCSTGSTSCRSRPAAARSTRGDRALAGRALPDPPLQRGRGQAGLILADDAGDHGGAADARLARQRSASSFLWRSAVLPGHDPVRRARTCSRRRLSPAISWGVTRAVARAERGGGRRSGTRHRTRPGRTRRCGIPR